MGFAAASGPSDGCFGSTDVGGNDVGGLGACVADNLHIVDGCGRLCAHTAIVAPENNPLVVARCGDGEFTRTGLP